LLLEAHADSFRTVTLEIHRADKMSVPKVFHCIVDDTALITNISEIKTWVSQGIVTLVVPLYSTDSANGTPPPHSATRLTVILH
jgi:hypothetical protein